MRKLQIAAAVVIAVKIVGSFDYVSETVTKRRAFYESVAGMARVPRQDLLVAERAMLADVGYSVCPRYEMLP